MKSQGSVGGICIVRDARDIVGLLCGHYLRIGFARIAFVDDGSTDGTYEFLTMLSRRTSRVSVRRVQESSFHQPALITELANALVKDGYDLIVPFDADEFWNVTAQSLIARYRYHKEICFSGQLLNFVQKRSKTGPSLLGLLSVTRRAPQSVEANSVSIPAFQYPFVCHLTHKIAFKTRREVTIDRGQHNLLAGPARRDAHEYEIFHIPLRFKSELAKRAWNYEPRRAPLREDPQQSWQSKYFREVIEAGHEEDLWRANSADADGYLNCDTKRIALHRDRRLQRLLLLSWIYMATHFGTLTPT